MNVGCVKDAGAPTSQFCVEEPYPAGFLSRGVIR
jgi:hypothetical protein